MDEFLELLLIVLVIYASECVGWVRSGRLVVRDVLFGFRRSVVGASRTLTNGRNGVVLLSPFPFDISLRASRFELSVSPRGVFAQTFQSLNGPQRPTAPDRALTWQDLDARLEINGSKLRLARGVVADLGSPLLAHRARRLVESLRSAPSDEDRAARIDRELTRRLEARRARNRFARVRFELVELRWLSTMLFVGIFGALPALYYSLGIELWWKQLGLVLLAIHVMLVWRFTRAHRRLYPRLGGERGTKIWLFSLSPLAGLRAPDALARESLGDLHALAVARAFVSDAAFEELAARAWRDACHPVEPIAPAENELAQEIESWFRLRARGAMESMLREHGLDPERLLEPPEAREPESVAYCPRCEDQFVRLDAICADCGSRSLEPLSTSTTAP